MQVVSPGQEHLGESKGGDEAGGLFLLSLLTVVKLKEVRFVQLHVDLHILHEFFVFALLEPLLSSFFQQDIEVSDVDAVVKAEMQFIQ